jgi:deoxyhypusine synthase
MESSGRAHQLIQKISRKRIDPPPVRAGVDVPTLIDNTFLAFNAGRLGEACRQFARKMLADDVNVGQTLSGAQTPSGLGK